MKIKCVKIVVVLLRLFLPGCAIKNEADQEQPVVADDEMVNEEKTDSEEPLEDRAEQLNEESGNTDIETDNEQTEDTNISKEASEEVVDYDTAMRLYEEFLNNEIVFEDEYGAIDIAWITTATGEPEKHYATKYTYLDSTGDGIPELHVKSARCYFIFSCRNEELIIWQEPDRGAEPLDDGTFFSRLPGAAPPYDYYNVYVYDENGEMKTIAHFMRNDANGSYKYDEGDEFSFNDDLVTQEEWISLTSPWLDEYGNVLDSIRNEIEWVYLYD